MIAGAGFALLMLPGASADYWTGFLPGIAVLGFGMTVTIAPLTTTVMNAVDAQSVGIASGVNNAFSRVSGLMAIAIMGWIMGWVFEAQLQQRLQASGLPQQVVAAVWAHKDRLAAVQAPPGASPHAAATVAAAVKESFVAGFRVLMAICAGLAAASALVAFASIRGEARAQTKTGT
jgi:hypothetical protein